jgi:hypothetical protein
MVMSQRRSYRRSGNPFGRPRHEFSLMRTLGRVIIVVIVVSAIYIVVDFSGRIWAEAYVASEVENALGLSGKPDVTFGGPLFLPQLLSGELSSATAKMEDFTSNGVAFTEATLKLEQVQFSPAKLLFHDESTIVAQTGRGTATMTEQQLTDAFQAQGIPITLFFTAEGALRVQAAQFQGLSATVAATIEHGDLVLRPTNPLFKRISFTLDVPELVPGMTYESITFDPPFGELTFSLKDATFEVNASSE